MTCTDSVSAGLLCGLLGEVFDAKVMSVDVSRSAYTSSFPIDDVAVTFYGGDVLRLVRKNLAWEALDVHVRDVKPSFLYDPQRELGMYRHLLGSGPAGSAHWYGSLEREDLGFVWLLLEAFDGVGLGETGDVGRWMAGARWAAQLHAAFADTVEMLMESQVPLLVHDKSWLRRWAHRAVAAANDTDTNRAVRHVCDHVEVICERLAQLPFTLVHGEFYASNVLVGNVAGGLRVCPIDWETAALAPALVDLAALTSGALDPAMRHRIEHAYCAEAGRVHDDDFVAELDVCRLAQCIQWLGWTPGWEPAAHHSRDWLGEAVELTERLAL